MTLRFKKGNAIIDSLMVMIGITVFAICIVLGYQFYGDLNADLQANDDLSADGKARSQALYDRYPSFFDGLFLLLFALLWGLVIVASFMLDSHPIFFIFALLLLVFVLFIGATMTNFWDELTDDPEISSLASNFPIMDYLMNHLLIVICAIAFSVVLALYGKNRLAT